MKFFFYVLIILLISYSGCSKLKSKTFEFICPDGVHLKISYSENGEKATLIYEKKKYELERTISASGARYSDGHLIFWNKGDTAFIEIDGKKIHQDCDLKKEP